MKAIYAGSFDPITNGHLDLIGRAAGLFGSVVVAVARNSRKSPVFSEEERVAIVRRESAHFDNVSVEAFSGLVVEFARAKGAKVLVRGLRNVTDFDFEISLAMTNRTLAPDVESLFLMGDQRFAFVSSSLIKEIVACGGEASPFVPPRVLDDLRKRIGPKA